ncbi:MAG: prepilin-type N-terminal cleavage/methylation domain-containing protein [Burkholderiales bacterium]|nr:prepilin-type N-terminal cleavage/methylation domain-containing protein [Burkholderiales bacterium]
MQPRRAPLPRRSTRGFTLIEVLISILVFSFGLLGAAAMQAVAVQAATQNGDRSRAGLLANEMVSTLWAAQSSTPVPGDLAAWRAKVATPAVSGLPNGSGTVAACAGVANCAVITITWKAPSAKAAAASNRYTTTVVIQ